MIVSDFPRGGSKLARVIGLLERDRGATIEELITATGWLAHMSRVALTGLRKRGYAVAIDRSDDKRGELGHIYGQLYVLTGILVKWSSRGKAYVGFAGSHRH